MVAEGEVRNNPTRQSGQCHQWNTNKVLQLARTKHFFVGKKVFQEKQRLKVRSSRISRIWIFRIRRAFQRHTDRERKVWLVEKRPAQGVRDAGRMEL